ncbi:MULTISPECIES: NUDIX hydrolase [Brevundimonas]|uniref:NUDIX hydrolase n=1 Tax=Brevundimonas TaxID=41275 RepID=UPI000F021C1A|nr:NUDIX hydrolase [Brevundimonas lutea]
MSRRKGVRVVRDHRRQVAALPWRRATDGVEVLLVTSRETRRWVTPKGWPMPRKTAAEAAAQEAWEEAGVRGVIAPEPLGAFHYDKRLKNNRLQPCVVDLFPLEVTEEADAWPEADERERRWMAPREAAPLVDEPELTALIEAFGALKT